VSQLQSLLADSTHPRHRLILTGPARAADNAAVHRKTLPHLNLPFVNSRGKQDAFEITAI